MSPDIQVKLLRALETRQVRRLGGKKEITRRHPHRRGDEQGPAEGDRRRRAARGSLLPPRGRRDRPAAAARARRATSQLLAQRVPRRGSRSENGKKIDGFDDDGLGLDHRATTGRATCASCRTRSSGRSSWRAARKIALDDIMSRRHRALTARCVASSPCRSARRSPRRAGSWCCADVRVDRRRPATDGEDRWHDRRRRARRAARDARAPHGRRTLGERRRPTAPATPPDGADAVPRRRRSCCRRRAPPVGKPPKARGRRRRRARAADATHAADGALARRTRRSGIFRPAVARRAARAAVHPERHRMRHDEYDDEPYLVIEKHSGSVGSFLLGARRRRRRRAAVRAAVGRRDARASIAPARARRARPRPRRRRRRDRTR